MNLITRTIPVLILGLSGLALSSASRADSSLSVTFSSGYAVPHARYFYYNGYRPYARRYCPPVHIDTTYVEKHVYRNKGYYGRYRDNDDLYDNDGSYNEHRKYRNRGGHHSRRHDGDNPARRRHTSYARTTHY